mgnify:CR=1 FL=1
MIINYSLKYNKNGSYWENVLGYTQMDLRQYLEAQFKPGMTWNNYGKWHIDHIVPCASFDLSKKKEHKHTKTHT